MPEDKPLPDDLEAIGMGLPCMECGHPTSWLRCWNCSGEGGRGGQDLMDEDPLWYDEDDWETCDVCFGRCGHPYCIVCRKIVKVKHDE